MQPRTHVTPEAYLAFDAEAEGKHEYWDGRIVAMAGETPSHSTIKDNVVAALRARRPDCIARSSGVRVQTPGYGRENYAYPDAILACEPEVYDEATRPPTLLNPTLLVEVTSRSTRGRAVGEKFEAYFQIDTLQEYWILDSERRYVRRCVRASASGAEQGVLVQLLQRPEATLASEHLGLKIPLAEMYAAPAGGTLRFA